MKTVYCDVVFAANFAADFALMQMCARFLHIKPNNIRIAAACTLGAIFAIICAIMLGSAVSRSVLAVMFSAVMCRIGFGKGKAVRLLKITVTYVLFGMLLCGFAAFVASMMSYNVYSGGMSLWMIVVAVLIMCIAFFLFGSEISKESGVKKVDVIIECCGTKQSFTLMCDSGNLLTDPYSSLPVIVLKNDFTQKSEKPESFIQCKARYIPVKTAQGNGIIKAVKPERLEIISGKDNVKIDAVVGFSKNENADYAGTDGIITYCLVENL